MALTKVRGMAHSLYCPIAVQGKHAAVQKRNGSANSAGKEEAKAGIKQSWQNELQNPAAK